MLRHIRKKTIQTPSSAARRPGEARCKSAMMRRERTIGFLALVSLLLFLVSGATQEPGKTGEASRLDFSISLGPNALQEDLYQMALWIEDSQGKYLDTVYVTACTGKEGLGNAYMTFMGISLRSVPGVLPVWAHKRNIREGESYYPSKSKPLPDAMTGATAKAPELKLSFPISPKLIAQSQGGLVCRCEINVSRDGIPSMNFKARVGVQEKNTQPLEMAGYGDDTGRNGDLQEKIEKKVEVGDLAKALSVTFRPAVQNGTQE